MLESLKNSAIFKFVNEKIGFRTPVMFVLVMVLFGFDFDTLQIIGFSLGFLFFQALASHLLRKILFPFLALAKLLKKIEEEALPASLAFIGVCIVLSTLLHSASSLWIAR